MSRATLIDLLHLEAGQLIGFLDDPGGSGAFLAGEILGHRRDVSLYGLFVGDECLSPAYDDERFDLIVAAGGRRSWPRISRSLGDLHRLVRPGGTIAVSSPHPLSLVGRGLRRLPSGRVRGPRISASAAGHMGNDGPVARDAHDLAVGQRLVSVFGSAVRAELDSRVLWRAAVSRHHAVPAYDAGGVTVAFARSSDP